MIDSRSSAASWVHLLRTDVEGFNREIESIPRAERTMLVGADLSGVDLRAASLRRCDLSGACLEGARCDGLTLLSCRLQGARLEGVRCEPEYLGVLDGVRLLWTDPAAWNARRAAGPPPALIDVDLSGADLQDANLRCVLLIGARLDGARLGRCKLDDANLAGASLVGASFAGFTGRGVTLSEAILDFACFIDAELRYVRLTGARATKASFICARLLGGNACRLFAPGAELDRATFAQVLLYDAQLEGSSFRGAKVERCVFDGANLKGCTFQDATLNGCEFDGADLAACDWSGARRVDRVR